jgi:Ca2+-transporting ATPase
LVVTDDDFTSIVAAVRLGRRIYENLRRAMAYVIAVHVPIAGLSLLPVLFGWPLVLFPVHIVFLELVIDPTCSIVFELEPAEADVMSRPPRGHAEHLFEARRVLRAVLLGIGAFVGPFVVLAVAHGAGAPGGAVSSLAFAALIAANLALVAASRARPWWRRQAERNPAARWMVAIVGALVATTFAVPWLRDLFRFATVEPRWLAGAVLAGALPVLALAVVVPAGEIRGRAVVVPGR